MRDMLNALWNYQLKGKAETLWFLLAVAVGAASMALLEQDWTAVDGGDLVSIAVQAGSRAGLVALVGLLRAFTEGQRE